MSAKPEFPTAPAYPFAIPAVAQLAQRRLEFHPKVTFLVGENGSGKSTLIEALALALGMNPEGGTRNFSFSTRDSHSELHSRLRIARAGSIGDGFFLRAESLFNLATSIEEMDAITAPAPPVIDSYGGQSLHELSHGESFLAVAEHRLGRGGVYLMDEPEAALSPTRILTLLHLIDRWVSRGTSQLVIATHSPILIAYPHSTIYELGPDGIEVVPYERTALFQLYQAFMASPEAFTRRVLGE